MEKYRKTEILQIVEEEGVEFIRLQFTDMFGTLKNVAVPVSCLEKAMDDRSAIDLASLNGFAKEEETELYLKPDFSTFTILPCVLRMEKLPVFCVTYAQRMKENMN